MIDERVSDFRVLYLYLRCRSYFLCFRKLLTYHDQLIARRAAEQPAAEAAARAAGPSHAQHSGAASGFSPGQLLESIGKTFDSSMVLESDEESEDDDTIPSVEDQMRKYLALSRKKVKDVVHWWQVRIRS